MPRPSRNDALLDGLVELYLEHGFLAFGVGDLAARLHCSRTTLYGLATSKEQLILTTVRGYFRRSAERIEARVAAEPDAGLRLRVYLAAVSDELAPAGDRFFADLSAYPPAQELYEQNTRQAARRVQALVSEGVAAGRLRPINARFVGAAVAEVMSAIQVGRLEAASGIGDAEAYAELADLVHRAVAATSDPASMVH